MKKLLAIIFSLVLLAGCADNGGTAVVEETTVRETETVTSESTETTAAVTSGEISETTTTETTAATTAADTEKIPAKEDLGVNADGTLNEAFTERLAKLSAPDEPVFASIYPALWDFDGDGVPEIILTYHNGGQGLMPCYVYNAETLEKIGEFEGFCRDGFTRFINTMNGTVIYNYYEHSVHQRVETAETVRTAGGKLVNEPREEREWLTAWGEIYPAHIEFSEEYSNTEDRGYGNRTAEYYFGNVCSSYENENYDGNRAEFTVESYNNYIKFQPLRKENEVLLIFGDKNQYVFHQTEEECFFVNENGERTLMKEGWAYYNMYTLWGAAVCQPLGNAAICDVYVMSDGKPELVPELSGKGMFFDYSHFYIGRYELTESVYDGMVMESGGGGMHTFKKYQFYRDKDGFHEYGSIVVPMEEFTAVYGGDIEPLVSELAAENTKIHEVLYRSDGCFILNCRETIFLDEEKTQPAGAYYTSNITLKPLYDGGFAELCRDMGTYKTALIPEIAVYPEKMYIPE